MTNALKQLVIYILTWEARLVLLRYKPKIIAVTGSVGKSTTKDAIYAVLSGRLHVRKSEKSFNSDVGVPLAILGCENGWKNPFKWLANIAKGFWLILIPQSYPKWLVLEVGADRPGDIRKIAGWLKPDIAVLTAIPETPAHVEFFKSSEELMKEKFALAESLKPGGTLVLYGDDPKMLESQRGSQIKKITFGLQAYNDFVASHDETIYEDSRPIGTRFRVNYTGSSVPISIFGALGHPPIYAGLSALAVGKMIGLDLVSISNALGKWVPPPGRLRILKGLKNSVIIDDAYNSSPTAALTALDTLKSMTGAKRRIAILGDMLELGKWSAESHRKLGAKTAECADMLLTVGFRAREVAESAKEAGMKAESIRIYGQNESARAGKELASELQEGDIVLVKGSQGMRMERAVLEIMEEPKRASELLVRQEPEWLKKS
ncbi:MAG: UDP-N-acetylmuramoyl-tripeptide--D-alanyl-D-alanine ligase [Candidatus Kaiserbacteria bacterium]|nr:UDP-N-acetylmuramoyl-tripeptide--D-alanyl-D-alanine ligase [Candidatus Kaiserbacteria bacterium]